MYHIYYMDKNKKVYIHFGRCFRFLTEKEARRKFNSLPESKRRVSFIEYVKKEEGEGV